MAYESKPKIRNANWNYGGSNWKLSRSKIDLFMECPRCFYLDNKLGVSRPRGPAFTLNIAVDALLKKEFDIHRSKHSPHPLMEKYKVDAVPFDHEDMEKWRENFVGIQYKDENLGLLITGAIDDIWIDGYEKLIVVDYKATAKDGKVESLGDTKWQNQYQRQMEIYQWLLRKKGFEVSDTGYFVYVNGQTDRKAFDGKLEFDVTLIAHTGKTDWIEETLIKIKTALDSNKLPESGNDCEFCAYREFAGKSIQNIFKPKVDEKNKEPKPGKLF